jgi:hypothetical protein
MKRLPSTGVPFVIRLLKAAADLLGRPDGLILLTESFLDFDHPALAFRMHRRPDHYQRGSVSRSAATSAYFAYFFRSNVGRS